jgi:ABC-type multidrug transport system ATPase subunit
MRRPRRSCWRPQLVSRTESRIRFSGVDFAAKPGETVAIVGPSGAGKTTLVKVLAGLLDRTEGTLTAAARDVRDWDRLLPSRIGVVNRTTT